MVGEQAQKDQESNSEPYDCEVSVNDQPAASHHAPPV